jgi:hypothetical protein
MVHDYDSFTHYHIGREEDRPQSFAWHGPLTSGGSPTIQKTATKVWVEYIESGGAGMNATIRGNSDDGLVTGFIPTRPSSVVGDIDTLYRNFNYTSTNLRLSITGIAPVQIRSIMADIVSDGSEERLG